MKPKSLSSIYLTFISIAFTYVAFTSKVPFLKEGAWRGVFQANGVEIPFLFEVKGKNAETATIYLVNGTEKVPLTNLIQKEDSIFIPIELYDAVLAIRLDNEKISGVYKRLNTEKPDQGIPFTAEYGKQTRFKNIKMAPKANLSGKWDVNLYPSPTDTTKTVGIFEQKGNYLTGTIMTTTGDYRYLEGSVQGEEFYLSVFSGSGPLLIKGKIGQGNQLAGEFINARSKTAFTGIKNDKAALPDAYSLTHLKPGYTSLDFTFPDLDGKPVSLKDPKYKDKVVIVTILGSWCPNCIDETAFLAPWYKANKQRGVEIIGLAFERKNDLAYANYILSKLIKRFDVKYDILFAGLANKEAASQALPALSKVLSFPTTIIIDRKGNVSNIHTGFTGPATGSYYEEYINEFNEEIDKLLKNDFSKASIQKN
jgi:peroxiredoxin